MFRLRLDRSSTTPLYHQIVQAIRWRVGTGALRPGDPLPPIREAAEQWQVNYHTVRRAYHELAEQGLVESLQGSGTQVASGLPGKGPHDDRALDRWLAEVLETAADRFGLSANDVARRIHDRQSVSRVLMVECNAHESRVLARQMEEAWSVEAIPWSLEQTMELPPLPIIGTYFHHAEMRRRWPHRLNDMHFVTLHLDPALKARIERVARSRRTRVLHVVEQDPATALEMAAGVAALLSRRFTIETVVGNPNDLLQSLPGSELLLVAPRLWDDVLPRVRRDPRVFDLRYVIAPDDLQSVWHSLNTRQ